MTSFRRSTPGLRGRLLLSVLGALIVVLAALTLGFNLVLADRLGSDANGLVQARASAELASLRVSHDQIRPPEAPDDYSPDTQIWVFQGSRTLEQPRTVGKNDAAAAAIAARAPALRDVSSTGTRLYSLPVVQAGRRLGAVVAGVSLAPYRQTRDTALVASIVLAAAVLIAVGLAAKWLIGRALLPVARMTRQAAEWSEHDLDRRFAMGAARDELTQLGSTLDDLLERLAASLRHEQRLSAEISHELRTPLARIVAEAQYALRHGGQSDDANATLEHILQSARQLSRTLDTLMAAARGQLDPGEQRATQSHAHTPRSGPAIFTDYGLTWRSRSRNRTIGSKWPPSKRSANGSSRHYSRTPPDTRATRFRSQSNWMAAASGSRSRTTDPACPPTSARRSSSPVTASASGPPQPQSPSQAQASAWHCAAGSARTAGGDVIASPSDAGGRFIVALPAA